jgi:hypothetical protein
VQSHSWVSCILGNENNDDGLESARDSFRACTQEVVVIIPDYPVERLHAKIDSLNSAGMLSALLPG